MSLREEIERRKAGLPPPCVSISKSPQTLSVRLANGDRWSLDWARYVQARLGSGEDELTLVFAESEVVVRGRHLAVIMDSVDVREVERLRELPADYSGLSDEREPFITSLELHPRVVP
jgi:hypothetical protein